MGHILTRRPRGVVLIVFALSSVAIFGLLGFAIDYGRLFIARNEAQAFCDAAAMAAASLLDGSSAGITAAKNAVTGTYLTSSTDQWKKYAFQSTTFTSPTVQFSTDNSTWVSSPASGTGYSFAKVTATAQLPMYFSTVVTGQNTRTATASAVAGQVLKLHFDEGLMPLDLMAHCTQPGTANLYGFTTCPCAQPGLGATAGVCTTQSDVQALGLSKDRSYDLRWPNDPFKDTKPSSLNAWCDGDGASYADTYNPSFQTGLVAENPNNNGGFWHSTTVGGDTTTYRQLLAGMMGIDLGAFLGGFDTSPSGHQTISTTLAAMASSPATQFVLAPVIDPVSLTVVGVREVKLVGSYGGGGSSAWCADYVGPAVYGTGGTSVGAAGIYEVRLVM